MKLIALLFIILLASAYAFGQSQQYVAVAVCDVNGVYINGVIDKEPPYVLTDSLSGVQYMLLEDRNTIRAINIDGSLLWETNPRKIYPFEQYRVAYPVIIAMSFHKGQWTDDMAVVAISYNNSQFGYLHKETGKFQFLGQD